MPATKIVATNGIIDLLHVRAIGRIERYIYNRLLPVPERRDQIWLAIIRKQIGDARPPGILVPVAAAAAAIDGSRWAKNKPTTNAGAIAIAAIMARKRDGERESGGLRREGTAERVVGEARAIVAASTTITIIITAGPDPTCRCRPTKTTVLRCRPCRRYRSKTITSKRPRRAMVPETKTTDRLIRHIFMLMLMKWKASRSRRRTTAIKGGIIEITAEVVVIDHGGPPTDIIAKIEMTRCQSQKETTNAAAASPLWIPPIRLMTRGKYM